MELPKKLTRLKDRLQDLSEDEAYAFMKEALGGNIPDIRVAAFLTALRIKGETVDELTGITKAVKEKIISRGQERGSLDLALNYDGKERTLYILPSAIFVASIDGVTFTYHYADKVPVKEGTTLNDIFVVMSDKYVPVKTAHQREFAPSLYRLMPVRRALGFRTALNVIEKMINPFGSGKVIVSVFHKPYFEKIAGLCERLGFADFTLIKGLEGGIEPFTDRPTLYLKKDKDLKVFDPQKAGIKLPDKVDSDNIVRDSLELNEAVVRKKAPEDITNWSLLTAGFLLFASGRTSSPEEGFERARELYSQI